MEVTKKMNVPASFLYDKIMDSVIYDIRQQTGKALTRKQLAGYKFTKKFAKAQTATMQVTEVIENKSYHFMTTTNRNSYVVQYDIEPIDEGKCLLNYTEHMESKGTLQQMNDVMMALMMGFFKKRNFKKMLSQIEASYK